MEKSKKNEEKLTNKQKAFCKEYIVDYNGTQAAVRAGYSRGGAEACASRLLTIVKIQRFIKKLEAEKAERNNITVDKVLSEYAKIAFTDLPGIVNYSRGTMSIEDFEKLTPDQRSCIKKFKIKTGKPLKNDPEQVPCDYVEIELHDKQHALDMIGKHLGMFVDRQEIEYTGGVLMVNTPSGSSEEWEKQVSECRQQQQNQK